VPTILRVLFKERQQIRVGLCELSFHLHKTHTDKCEEIKRSTPISWHLLGSLAQYCDDFWSVKTAPSLYLRKKKYSAACLALKRHLGSLLQILECLRRPREGAFFSDLAADPKVF
jgi:hypothetical protein